MIVSAKTDLGVELLLPDRLGSRFLTGNRMPLFAFVSGQTPLGSFSLSHWSPLAG